MKKSSRVSLLLVGSIALVGLSGCEQMEQAATEAVETAKQTAVQALQEASQTGSIDEARQTATQALRDAKQQAAGVLGQASEYLSSEQQNRVNEQPLVEDSTTAL